MTATKRKATGAHFTPPELARLLAERLVPLMQGLPGAIRVLDPACGDGNLLCAMAEVLPSEIRRRTTLVGIENDSDSFTSLRLRQSTFGTCHTDLISGDFLDFFREADLFESSRRIEPVDVIIANPPYVRTQVLGAKRAQRLAARFGLSGRVDLYQAFLVAMARQLRPGGILGVITSNRFLTTRAGMTTRRILRTHFELIEIVDLGDTKLFEAAVLPALVFARKRGRSADDTLPPSEAKFVRVYEAGSEGKGHEVSTTSVLEGLRNPKSGLIRSNGNAYRITTGRLPVPEDDAHPWTLLSSAESQWVAAIDAASECRFGDVAKIRVGIKTTADDVFIHRDWASLSPDVRPERRYLRPLLSQEDAAKWRPLESDGPRRQVLYTHQVVRGRRRAIQFQERSPTWKYLLKNRKRLESRHYVLDAGRAWYEIWVPQDPKAWSLPKIVLPDISPDPRFFLDTSGCIVDGNCYWITTNDAADNDLLLLLLGVANSALMSRYHDLAFQNKLYAQRKRHLTQYVEKYPLPRRRDPACRQIIRIVGRLVRERLPREMRQRLESEIDRLVVKAFGTELLPIDTAD
jgi:tRNA1(Val) A37 N6-methylase TrmN6